jgi:hypothetical protein
MSLKTKKRQGVVLVSAIALMLSLVAGSAFAQSDHTGIPLRDANGDLILASETLDNAYSTKETCGACHDYDAIEQHSYHTQLAANEHYGYNPMNPDGDVWESGAGPMGKSWVQGQGHVGAW